MKVEIWDIKKLVPYARNPRKNDMAIPKVKASLLEFGWQQPIVVDSEGIIIVGHTRFAAATELGMTEVPVQVAFNLTPQQVKAYRILDNKTGEYAEWDQELLAAELSECDLAAIPEFKDLDFGVEEEKKEAVEDDFEAPPIEEIKTDIKYGDIIQIGQHRLMCGDSTKIEDVERLMDGKKADMVFTDPPYGVNYEGGHFHSGNVDIKRKREKLASDQTTAIYFDFLPVALKFVDGPCYMWFADSKVRDVYNAVFDNKCDVHALIIWHKTNATYAAMNAQYKQRHEPCLYFKPKGSTLRWCGATTEATVWSQDRDGINEFHPTQKPISLASKAMNNHDAKLISDFFLGSGSTMVACHQLDRICYGMELEPKYCQVIVDRMKKLDTTLEIVING